jgi:catechol 2,3-dioxygenase-like lactoylglutathione lyase family enzyme
LDVDNGERLDTTRSRAGCGSGEVVVNGSASRLVHPGNTVIVVCASAVTPTTTCGMLHAVSWSGIVVTSTDRRGTGAGGRAGQSRFAWFHTTEERTLSDQRPNIDVENLPAPTEGILVTQFLTVRNVARARAFYSDVLGGEVVLEENPCIVRLANSWVIMNPGGPPTPDKPEVTLIPNERSNRVSSFLNLRVADIRACYRDWSARGAEFLTEPLDRGAELRCYMRDPDGYLIEVGQSTGLLVGQQAEIRPEDLPADG